MAAKKGVASKVAAGTKAKAADADLIFATAQEVENLTAVKAFSMVETLMEDIEQNSFKLGGALSVIQEKCQNGDPEFLGDSKSFKDLCNERFAMHHRKALYLISTYRNLTEKSIPYSAVQGLGWSKIAILAPIINAKNVESWVAKAKKLTFVQLVEAVKKKTAAGGKDATETEGDDTITTMTFKLKKDQKEVIKEALAKAKGETKTDYDSVALSNLAVGYLGGSVEIPTIGGEAPEAVPAEKPKKLTKAEKVMAMVEAMKDLGLDDTLAALNDAFPKITLDVTVPEE
jgi:hypothetical protein